MFCLSGFRIVKMSRGIPQTPAHGWNSQIFVLTQVVGGLKYRFRPFLTFLAYRVHGCSHSGVVGPVQLDRVEYLEPSHIIGPTRKSREIQEQHL